MYKGNIKRLYVAEEHRNGVDGREASEKLCNYTLHE